MKMIFILLLGTSCATSTMVRNASERPQFAPKGYKEKGVVKYLNQGADSIIKSRREDAFKQMHMSCNGEYEILSEYKEADAKTLSDNGYGGIDISNSWNHIFIEYQCTGDERKPANNTINNEGCMTNQDCGADRICATIKGDYPGSCVNK